MGEVRVWKDKEDYIQVLEKEISVLKGRYNPNSEGTGHYNTAISVLEDRVKEIKAELNWPFPGAME